MELRPYQMSCVEELRGHFRTGHKRLLLVSPTGSGKTVLFAFVTQGAASRGLRVLVLAHRSEILDQISRTLRNFGVDHVMLTAGRSIPPSYQVMVASVQTLCRRLEGSPHPDLVIVDEAHHSCAGSWAKVFAAYPKARWLGVTATPERLDGKGLGDFYHQLVLGPRVQWLIDNGFLARPRYFAAQHVVDASGLRKVAGEYNRKDVAEAVDRPSITGDAIDQYRKHASGRTCIAFCVSIEHANHVADSFKMAGVSAEVIDGTMSPDQRRAIVDRLRVGKTLVLVSVDLVSEGFDLPAVGAASLLRHTASLALHLQQVGRVLRPSPGKNDAIILDHVGNCTRHGLAEEDREWSLAGYAGKKRTKETTIEVKQCDDCFRIYRGRECPECGAVKESKRAIEVRAGELQEVAADRMLIIRQRLREENDCRSLEDFQRLARARGYRPGWAYFRWQNSWRRKAAFKTPVPA